MSLSQPPRVEIGSAGLRLNMGTASTDVPLLCGAVHYFAIAPEHWARCLDGVVALGLTVVDVSVPWSVHEVAPGRYDFAALDRFLRLCHERGLYVLLRPGPQVNGQLSGFGFPDRVLRDPDCHARGARGHIAIFPAPPRCFPIPSYASERLLAAAEHWLGAVAQAVEGAVWPNGPIVAVRVDGELSFFYRTGAYDQDYHPDAVAFYQRYVAERYAGSLPSGYAHWRGEPPREFDARNADELVVHLDWLAAKEALLCRALERLSLAATRDRALGRALTLHNLPTTSGGEPCSISAAEGAVDIAGFEFYPRGRNYGAARRTATLLGPSRLPTLLGLCWGGWHWWFPQRIEDQLANVLAAVMHGVRGIDLQMVVGRDRWYGAPIAADGSRDERCFELTARLVGALRESRVFTMPRDVRVAVLRLRDYRRLAVATSLVDPVSPLLAGAFNIGLGDLASDETFGLSSAVQREYDAFLTQIEQTLTELRVPYHLIDDDAPIAALTRYRTLIVVCFDFIDAATVNKLVSYTAEGGQLLLGPRVPTRDRTMAPLGSALPPFQSIDSDDLGEDGLGTLLGASAASATTQAMVEAMAIADERGEEQVLFVANRDSHSATLQVPRPHPAATLWDALSGVPLSADCVTLDAQQVRFLRWRLTPVPPAADEGSP